MKTFGTRAQPSFRRIETVCMFLVVIALLTACTITSPYTINLMPAPEVYDHEAIYPFSDVNPFRKWPYRGMLYATNRQPAAGHRQYYLNERGDALRLGIGRITLGKERISWEEARRISLLKNRTDKYPLKVTDVEEIGVLDRSINMFTHLDTIPSRPDEPAKRFANLINEKLRISKKKDIFVYVHGYKVVFENPLLVAAELWHFLGYDGVFIAFAWPSTPKRLAYVSDIETAELSAYYLRIFIEYLSEKTDASRIHIIGYSAGTRLLGSALNQLALLHMARDKTAVRQKLRIGNVILVASDVDRQLFGAYLAQGLLTIPHTLTIYMSETDKALGFSRWIFRRDRLGQMMETGSLSPRLTKYLEDTEKLILINVTDAQGAATGNGHAYFRKSPWVSSDILMTLMYDLPPARRGLINVREMPFWSFPPDYLERLRKTLNID